jgi:hypothetical protein
MAIQLHRLEEQQEIEAVVGGPGSANRLFIYNGIAVFQFEGTGSNWHGDFIEFEIGRVFVSSQVHAVSVIGSLNSIENTAVANNAGWAVDSVRAALDPPNQRIVVHADLAVRDNDGAISRMAYQVTVLATI